MSDDIDPESTIPWPGFVDILSTVIIVFVFFMMMTSVIIFVLSDQAQKKAVENAVKAKLENKQDPAKTAPNDRLTLDVNSLLAEKVTLQEEIDHLVQFKNVLSESYEQKAVREDNAITITFGDMGATLVPATTDMVKAMFPFAGHVTIQAMIPAGSDFGSIREIALNRALNVRNILLQNGVTSDRIALRIAVPETPKDVQKPIEKQPTPDKQQATDKSRFQYGSVKIIFEK